MKLVDMVESGKGWTQKHAYCMAASEIQDEAKVIEDDRNPETFGCLWSM